MKINAKLTIALVLLILLLIFIIQNSMVVELRFLFWTSSVPRSLLILFSIFVGMVIGWFLSRYIFHKWDKNKQSLTQSQVPGGQREHHDQLDNQN